MRLEIAVGEMKPVEVVGVVLVGRRESESSVTVDADDIFGAGGGFGEGDFSVLDDGSLGERIQVLYGLGAVDGGALVQD